MKKITITNAYTWYNKGDAGILLGIVEILKKAYGKEIEINILSFTPEEDKKRYCKDESIKNVYSSTLNPFPYRHTKFGKLFAIIKLFFRMCNLYIRSKISLKSLIQEEESYKVLNESDVIIVCGGGFLGGKKYDSLMHLFQIYIDTIFKKKVVVMGTSIEPINSKIIKKYTEKVLKRVDYIFAREQITYNYLGTFLNKDKYEIVPDMAFMVGEETYKNDKINLKNKVTFGITVRKWNFPNIKESANLAMTKYKQAIAETMTKYIKEENACFIYIPQVIVENGNDTIVAKEIKELLEENIRENFIILEEDLSPMQIKGLIGTFDFFIGTRMHSNIFATSMYIPTVAIAYEKKTNGIMKMLNLKEYIVEMDDITPETLTKKIEELIKNKDSIKNILKIKIKEVRNEILGKTVSILKKI